MLELRPLSQALNPRLKALKIVCDDHQYFRCKLNQLVNNGLSYFFVLFAGT